MKTEQVFVVQKFENGEWENYDEFSTEPAAKEHHYCLRLHGKPDDIFRVIYRETTICETDIDDGHATETDAAGTVAQP